MARSMLVIDDEDSLRKLYFRVFVNEGYDITLAASLAEGREFLESSSYDLVLTDLVLGDGAGTELLTLAAGRETPPALILVSGAIEAWEIPLFTEKYGLDHCFIKPFPLDALVRVVKELIG